MAYYSAVVYTLEFTGWLSEHLVDILSKQMAMLYNPQT
jgi:hypothetical protein